MEKKNITMDKNSSTLKNAHDQVVICMIEDDVVDTSVLLISRSTFESELFKHAPKDTIVTFQDLADWFLKQMKSIKGRDDPRRSAHNRLWATLNDWCEDTEQVIDLSDCQIMSPFCFLTVDRSDE